MSKKTMLIVLAGLPLAGVSGGVVALVVAKPHTKVVVVKAPKVLKPEPLDDFIVNLADTDQQHYVKAAITLEVGDAPNIDDRIKNETAGLRDAIITAMSKRRFHDLLSDSGKATLKDDIKTACNRVLGDDTVVNVYFTSLAMQ